MRFLSRMEQELIKYNIYKPFPERIELDESRTIIDVERFLSVTIKESLEGNARAQADLELLIKAFKNDQ